MKMSLAEVADIPGWFDFDEVYDLFAERHKDRVIGWPTVEVGSWLGKSTVYLAKAFKSLCIDAPIFAVDTFTGDPNSADQLDTVQTYGGSIWRAFNANLFRCGVRDKVFPIKRSSLDAAKLFGVGSVAHVFLDADHSFDATLADLVAWHPKLITGGILAGHDYDMGEVRLAVDKFLRARPEITDFKVIHRSFWMQF